MRVGYHPRGYWEPAGLPMSPKNPDSVKLQVTVGRERTDI